VACSGRGIGVARQPEADLGVLMGGVVIDDPDARRALPDGLVDAHDEAEKLLMTVAWFALVSTVPVAMSSAANKVVLPCRT